ncbi:MAG TPA: hypothetical protein VKE51_18830 [Vicinamibacterales bacterium]|nr:hypothetical protein [Vicinamibacterales bacterium]
MPPRLRLGCLPSLVLILAVAALLFLATDAVFAPWSYFLGGRFHLLPLWQGAGTMHTASGDYVLELFISPEPGGRTFNFPYFRGWGTLCTPRGERYSMRVSASMFDHPGVDTNGERMEITMYARPWNYSLTGSDGRPRLTFRGRWQNPNLVVDDGGTLSRAFLPDNTVYRGPASRQPPARETVSLVLHETPWRWLSDCRTVR